MNNVQRICLAIVYFWALSCAGQESVDQSRRNAIVRAIERAAPAVATINVVEIQRQVLDPLSLDFFNFFDFPQPRVRVRERAVQGIGSGFIFDAQGHIVTNYHVVKDADLIASVTLSDGRELEVEFVGADEITDIAVLRAKGRDFPYIELGDSDNLLIGEWVIAIGNPFGGLMTDPHPSASVGVVSANHRRVSPNIGGGRRLYQDMIQTDAAINPGNSGGPLVNANGQAVGVNTFIISQSGGSIGLGFAVPINRVRRAVNEIIQNGRRRNPWPGFHVETLDGNPGTRGCVVVNILEGSPAYRAGLRPGDVITTINGQSIADVSDVDFAIKSLFVGDTATLEVSRQGAGKTVRFEIRELTR
ncbi:MAG: trypsin-like peptidase domain-containing protein [Candidatus Hydrogenedentes bacterium]|nr:trypsin-like peptidase domain-containing protein [Candidatus Hydrogenedentota bacterium]